MLTTTQVVSTELHMADDQLKRKRKQGQSAIPAASQSVEAPPRTTRGSPMAREMFEILKRFDELPDDALVPPRVAAVVLGVSERTVRRHPPAPFVQVSPQCRNLRVGNIRAKSQGQSPPNK
jgi:hypothetical protein